MTNIRCLILIALLGFAAAPALAQVSVLPYDTGCVMHLSGSNSVILASGTQNVAEWRDISPFGAKDATHPDLCHAVPFPVKVANAVKGRASIRFGNGSYFMVPYLRLTSFTGFIVYKFTTNSTPMAHMLSGDATSISAGGTAAYPNFLVWDGAKGRMVSGTASTNVWKLMSFKGDTIWDNGNLVSYAADGQYFVSGPAGGLTVRNIGIASVPAWRQTQHFNGEIAEIILFSRSLTGAQRQSIEAYLRARYF